MESTDYNIAFVYIKGRNNVLEDAISRMKISNIYKRNIGEPQKHR